MSCSQTENYSSPFGNSCIPGNVDQTSSCYKLECEPEEPSRSSLLKLTDFNLYVEKALKSAKV